MRALERIRGAITALVTPFRSGALDEAALERLVERQIAAGVHGLVPVGTTGETATLSHEEHRKVVEICVAAAAGAVPVIAGAGSNSTAEAIDLVHHARDVGADAALVVTPYYNRPSQEGLFRHYAAIAEAVDLPVFVYNVPSRTSIDISNETLSRLARLSNIVGVKDATGDMSRPSLQAKACGEDWILLSGDDSSALGYMAHGGVGCISVTANVVPGAFARFAEACLAGDFAAARDMERRLIRLHKALFMDASPAPTKFALARLGLCTEEVRLPLSTCAQAARAEIAAAMGEAGADA
ncbi:MAG: 4-hydroxy-tetrahydrodipicolinate synthase [Caulobacteraceae bacterium]